MPKVYLSLGSNLGDREMNIRDAISRLEGPAVHVGAVSGIYETEHVGHSDAPTPDYMNCALCVETSLDPEALLKYVQSVEREVGRIATFRWGPRSIDVDILWYEGIERSSEVLTLPHPRLKERSFVITPLAE